MQIVTALSVALELDHSEMMSSLPCLPACRFISAISTQISYRPKSSIKCINYEFRTELVLKAAMHSNIIPPKELNKMYQL